MKGSVHALLFTDIYEQCDMYELTTSTEVEDDEVSTTEPQKRQKRKTTDADFILYSDGTYQFINYCILIA
jgi:hypothetical protein